MLVYNSVNNNTMNESQPRFNVCNIYFSGAHCETASKRLDLARSPAASTLFNAAKLFRNPKLRLRARRRPIMPMRPDSRARSVPRSRAPSWGPTMNVPEECRAVPRGNEALLRSKETNEGQYLSGNEEGGKRLLEIKLSTPKRVSRAESSGSSQRSTDKGEESKENGANKDTTPARTHPLRLHPKLQEKTKAACAESLPHEQQSRQKPPLFLTQARPKLARLAGPMGSRLVLLQRARQPQCTEASQTAPSPKNACASVASRVFAAYLLGVRQSHDSASVSVLNLSIDLNNERRGQPRRQRFPVRSPSNALRAYKHRKSEKVAMSQTQDEKSVSEVLQLMSSVARRSRRPATSGQRRGNIVLSPSKALLTPEQRREAKSMGATQYRTKVPRGKAEPMTEEGERKRPIKVIVLQKLNVTFSGGQ